MQKLLEDLKPILADIDKRYGTGNNDGETPNKYHNRTHTEAVLQDSLLIGKKAVNNGNISLHQLELLIIAAVFHDYICQHGAIDNEEKSGEAAEKWMKQRPEYSTQQDIDEVKTAILSTLTYVENGVRIQPPASTYLGKLLADADLANLGQPPEIYWKKATAVCEEFCCYHDHSSETLHQFHSVSKQLLATHKYQTEEAAELWNHQEENLNSVIKYLEGFPNS